jgi:hypothetical protein
MLRRWPFIHYNFARIHKTLRSTQAMAVKETDFGAESSEIMSPDSRSPIRIIPAIHPAFVPRPLEDDDLAFDPRTPEKRRPNRLRFSDENEGQPLRVDLLVFY